MGFLYAVKEFFIKGLVYAVKIFLYAVKVFLKAEGNWQYSIEQKIHNSSTFSALKYTLNLDPDPSSNLIQPITISHSFFTNITFPHNYVFLDIIILKLVLTSIMLSPVKIWYNFNFNF